MKKAALAPQAEPAEPGAVRYFIVSGSATGGVRVTEDTALSLAAVWCCIKVISEDIACLPWDVFRSAPAADATRSATTTSSGC